MTGVAQAGAQTQLNALTGFTLPVVASSAPTGQTGLIWINTSSGNAVMAWNGTTFVAAGLPYLALLTADPTTNVTIAQLAECTDSGYSRVQVTFGSASAAYPSVASNTNLLTFGPFSVNMSLPCQWLALVTPASGTSGLLLNSWTISSPQQVSATQTINVAAGALSITQS